jgi:hypothetical protein
VHDLGVFYLMSRAANFPELVNDKVELRRCWSTGMTTSAMPCRRSVRRSRCSRPCAIMKPIARSAAVDNLSDVLLRRQQDRQPTASWRDATLDGEIDTSMLDTLFDADTLAEIVDESEEEVHSLKAALGG